MNPAPPSADAIRAAAKAGWGVDLLRLSRLPGHAHSINFKAESAPGAGRPGVFAVKCVPPSGSRRLSVLLSHLASTRSANAVRPLFGARILDICGWSVLALEWVAGRSVFPDEMDDATTDAFLESHARLLDGFADDGEIKPVFDLAAIKRSLAGRFAGCRAIERELALMGEETLVLSPEETRIIHGDLHWENFRFQSGMGCVFFDLEELRFGTPAEDAVRYFACRAEHMHWWDWLGRRRLAGSFARFAEKAPYSLHEWLYAINGYFLRKLDKKLAGRARVPPFLRVNLAFRGGFYAQMRAAAARVAASRRAAAPDRRVVVKAIGGTVARFMGGRVFDWNAKYRFTCDPACVEYDWLCIYDELPARRPEVRFGKMILSCPKEQVLLATQEPPTVKHYNRAYVRQFGVLLTNRPPDDPRHAGRVEGRGYMVWYTGRSFAAERSLPVPPKTKAVSAVYSAKAMRHTRHADRQALLETLERAVPGFDRFGKGTERPLRFKYDALDEYACHVAFENHVAPGFWTEKIADPLVRGCLPFYAGDPDIAKCLPAGCFIPIPPDDPSAAAATIASAVAGGEREKRLDAIAEARELLFREYNFFAQTAKAIEAAGRAKPDGPADSICTRRRARILHPLSALEDAVWALRKTATSIWRTVWKRRPTSFA